MNLYTRAIDPQTGKLLFDTTRNTWKQADSPIREVVVRVMRTPKGQCLANPSFGLDYSKLSKATPTLAADFEAATRDALAFLARSGAIVNLAVSASVDRWFLVYTLSFRDATGAVVRVQDRITL